VEGVAAGAAAADDEAEGVGGFAGAAMVEERHGGGSLVEGMNLGGISSHPLANQILVRV